MRGIIGFIAAIVVIAVIIGGGSSDKKSPDKAQASDATATAVRPAKSLSTRARIRKAIKSAGLGDGVRSISITKVTGGRLDVVANFTASDNLTKGMRRKGIELDMQKAYKAVYSIPTARKIQDVSIVAFFPMVDAYGNESTDAVYSTTLPGSRARRVNWKNADVLNWGALWDVNMQLPDFR